MATLIAISSALKKRWMKSPSSGSPGSTVARSFRCESFNFGSQTSLRASAGCIFHCASSSVAVATAAAFAIAAVAVVVPPSSPAPSPQSPLPLPPSSSSSSPQSPLPLPPPPPPSPPHTTSSHRGRTTRLPLLLTGAKPRDNQFFSQVLALGSSTVPALAE